jgi:hypothetical protein
MAARAAAAAARADTGTEGLPADAMDRLVTLAVQLLHNTDEATSKFGAEALAVASRSHPSLAHFGSALVIHPREEIRSVAASRAVLDETTQRLLAADSSPRVRAALARRAGELAKEVMDILEADDHPDVVRALTAAKGA